MAGRDEGDEWRRNAIAYWKTLAGLGEGVTPDLLIHLAEEGKANNFFSEQIALTALPDQPQVVDWLRVFQMIVADQGWKEKEEEYWNYVARLGSPEGPKITPQMLLELAEQGRSNAFLSEEASRDPRAGKWVRVLKQMKEPWNIIDETAVVCTQHCAVYYHIIFFSLLFHRIFVPQYLWQVRELTFLSLPK